jgi:hypothetical protein
MPKPCQRATVLAIARKIVLRIKSWKNCLFLP